jgi:hypothetical protein
MGQISSSVPHMTAEPGYIMIDKPFQVRPFIMKSEAYVVENPRPDTRRGIDDASYPRPAVRRRPRSEEMSMAYDHNERALEESSSSTGIQT